MSRPRRRSAEERIAAKRARAAEVEAARQARVRESEEYRARIAKLDAAGQRKVQSLYAHWVVGGISSEGLRAALSIAEGKAKATRTAILGSDS